MLTAFDIMAVSLAMFYPALAATPKSVPALAADSGEGGLIFIGTTALFSLIPINLSGIAAHPSVAAPRSRLRTTAYLYRSAKGSALIDLIQALNVLSSFDSAIPMFEASHPSQYFQ